MTIPRSSLHVSLLHDTDDLEYITPSQSCIAHFVPAEKCNGYNFSLDHGKEPKEACLHQHWYS